MSEAEQTVLMIRGAISTMPDDKREQLEATATEIRSIIARDPGIGGAAVALVGAELQLAAEQTS